MKLLVSLITPEDTYEYENIAHIVLPTMQGEVGIYPNHRDIVLPLVAGEIKREEDKTYDNLDMYKDHTLQKKIPGGIAYLTQDSLTIITSKSLV